jgi:outer membrane protein assembly factor BamB
VDASCVVVGNRVFAAGLDGVLYLLDLATGREVWRFTAGGGFQASPAVAAGRLVISTDQGVIHCFEIAP